MARRLDQVVAMHEDAPRFLEMPARRRQEDGKERLMMELRLTRKSARAAALARP